MSLTRRIDWRERLARYIEGQQWEPFQWGSNDCVTLVAGAIQVCTGMDPLSRLRGSYADETGAVQVLRGLGHETIAGAILDALCGRFRDRREMPQLGDVLVLKLPANDNIRLEYGGVVMPPFGVFIADRGLRLTSLPAILRGGGRAIAW